MSRPECQHFTNVRSALTGGFKTVNGKRYVATLDANNGVLLPCTVDLFQNRKRYEICRDTASETRMEASKRTAAEFQNRKRYEICRDSASTRR